MARNRAPQMLNPSSMRLMSFYYESVHSIAWITVVKHKIICLTGCNFLNGTQQFLASLGALVRRVKFLLPIVAYLLPQVPMPLAPRLQGLSRHGTLTTA